MKKVLTYLLAVFGLAVVGLIYTNYAEARLTFPATATGTSTLSGALSVSGTSQFTGLATFYNGLISQASSSFSQGVTVSGRLAVSTTLPRAIDISCGADVSGNSCVYLDMQNVNTRNAFQIANGANANIVTYSGNTGDLTWGPGSGTSAFQVLTTSQIQDHVINSDGSNANTNWRFRFAGQGAIDASRRFFLVSQPAGANFPAGSLFGIATSTEQGSYFDVSASGTMIVASSSLNHLGTFNVDQAGNVSVSGTLKTFGAATFASTTGAYTVSTTGLVYMVQLPPPSGTDDVMCYDTSGVNSGELTHQVTNCTISNRDAKNNIKPLTNALAKVLEFKPSTFNWKPEYGDPNKEEIGLIAQDVQAVDPRMVVTDKDGNLRTVYYDRTGVYAIAAIQEQQKQIEELKKEIAELKGQPIHQPGFIEKLKSLFK